MWKINIEDDQANVTTVNLVRDEYSVGRDVENAVRLTERNISRKHAALKRNGTGWILRDLGSHNGCFVNGKRINGEHALGHGDLVQLGDYRMELLDELAASQGDALSKTSTAPGRFSQTLKDLPNRLIMVAGPAIGVPFTLTQKRVVIGRGEECDLPINDTSVSRVHAEIRAADDGRYEIMDLGSSNGVRVNGVELKRSLLDAGDIIELGDVQLKYVPAGQIWNPTDPIAPSGRRHSLEPVGDRMSGGRGGANRFVILGAVLLAAVVVVVAATRAQSGANPPSLATEEPKANPAAVALEQAKERLDRGDLEGALEKARSIPEDSNLRESTVFKEIQSEWADRIFTKAAAEKDPAERRSLLDLIAKSPDVGSVQRKRAATEIAALDKDSVAISDLPSAARPEPTESATAEARPKAPPQAPVRPPAASSPPVAPTRVAPKQVATPAPEQEVKGGLVRDTPF
jgi:pSer/pThr/pTyr-binding forkhead associated (FHA) protein